MRASIHRSNAAKYTSCHRFLTTMRPSMYLCGWPCLLCISKASYETLPIHPSLYASESTNYVSLRLSLTTARASIRPCVPLNQLCVILLSGVTSCACMCPCFGRGQLYISTPLLKHCPCIHLWVPPGRPNIPRSGYP